MRLLTKQKNKLLSILKSLFFRPKSRRPFFVLALVLILLLFPLSQHALAQQAPSASSAAVTGASWIVGAAAALVTPVLQLINLFCGLLVDIAAHFLSFMLRPDLYNFTTEPIIVLGWTMVRDVCNLFFLLILLFIAFCTILQIEKYHLKKTLLTLIIMALLINFSKPIAIFIFDGAQLLMNYFLGAIGDYGTTVTSLSKITEIINKDLPGFAATAMSSMKGQGGFTGSALQYLFAIIFNFMYATALIVIAIYLLIRIVALWLIVIISPLAFLAMAVPDFKKMSSQWWDALFKYSYVGPAMAFFLWLSTRLATTFFVRTANNYRSGGTIVSMANLISFATVIVFLYASIIIAQKFGIQFASAITGYADRAMKWGTGLTAAKWGGRKAWQGAKYAGRAGARLADYKILAPLGISPRANWLGWKEGSAEAERKAMAPAVSAARDRWNKLLGRKEPADYHKNVQFESDVDKYMKEQRTISAEDRALIAVIDKFKNDKSPEAQKRVAAALRLMFENNDQNEFMKQYALKDEDFAKLNLKSNNPNDRRKALQHVLERSGMDEDQIGRQLFQFGNIALPKGNFGDYGMASFNAGTGKYEINDGRDDKHQQLPFARAKAKNIDVQEKMKKIHWNAILEENADGTTGGIHTTGMELLADMKQAEIAQFNRARPDFIERLYEKRGEISDFAKSGWVDPKTGKSLSVEQKNNLEHLVRALEIQYRGGEKGKEETKKKVDRTIKDEYDIDY